MPSLQLVSAVALAAVGWIATIIVIKRSRFPQRTQHVLMLFSWLPWIALALGAPLLSGTLSPGNILGIGGAVTAGVLVPTILSVMTPRR